MKKTMYTNIKKTDNPWCPTNTLDCYSVIRKPNEDEMSIKLEIEADDNKVIGDFYVYLGDVDECLNYSAIHDIQNFADGFGEVECMIILDKGIIKKMETLNADGTINKTIDLDVIESVKGEWE